MELLSEIIGALLSPMCITFVVIVVGFYIGKIKIFGISLDLSAVLVVAVLCGLVLSLPKLITLPAMSSATDNLADGMKIISSMGTSLFIATIGLTCGYTLYGSKGNRIFKNLIFGFFMAAVSFITLIIFRMIDNSENFYMLYGAFCGAMTSTPALTTVCENLNSSQATLGYGATYLFGVVAVVLFVQIIIRCVCHVNNVNVIKKQQDVYIQPQFFGIIQIAVSVITGYIFANFSNYIFGFSLGNSGAMLITASFIGYICAKKNKIISNEILKFIRGLGLVLFFVGTGIPAGAKLIGELQIKYVFYGIVMTLFPMLLSFFAARLLFKYSVEDSLLAVCGVMTSTPAVGVLMRNGSNTGDISVYSMTYTGALMSLVIGMAVIT